MAVLKADAYGHGAQALAPIAVQNGAAMIGVSSLEEGIHLRDTGIRAPILNLGGIYPLDNFSIALDFNITPTVASFEAARTLLRVGQARNCPVGFHLKIDTGMGRLGVSVEEAEKILRWAVETKGVQVLGVYSHLSCADSDPRFTELQTKRFGSVIKTVARLGLEKPLNHLANSAALLRYRKTHFDMVRPGVALFGDSIVPIPTSVSLFPVLSWHSRIIFLKKVPKGFPISYGRTYRTKKESLIATLPVGYADGVPRSISNKGYVLVRGGRCPIVGRVTMDQIMIDVTKVHGKVGDEVILVGRQEKDEIRIGEMAKWAGTISYEIFCGISKRVPRVVK